MNFQKIIRNLFDQNISEEEQPDLFTYARQGDPSEADSSKADSEENSGYHRPFPVLMVAILFAGLSLAFILGVKVGARNFWHTSDLKKRGEITLLAPESGKSGKGNQSKKGERTDGKKLRGILLKIDNQGLVYQDEELDNRITIPLSEIKRIEFLKELPTESENQDNTEENEKDKSLSDNERRFLGSYNVKIGGHKGTMLVYNAGGRLGIRMRFPSWGKGASEYMRGIRTSGKTIRFTRSCSGKGCLRLGTSPFRQSYQGVISSSRKTISGKYTGSHSSARWTATRR